MKFLFVDFSRFDVSSLEIKVRKMNLLWSLTDARSVLQLIENLTKVEVVEPNEEVRDRLTLRIGSTLSTLIREEADLNNMSVNNYIIHALIEKISTDAYIKRLEVELDNYSLIGNENNIFPVLKPEAFIDLDKFNRSRNRYKERKHGSKFRTFTLTESLS